MKKIIEVAAAVIVDESQRILVCERPAGKNSAGKWEFPGGKLEAGETPAAALQRELAEELAMQVRILSMMYQLQKVLPDGRLLRLYFLRAQKLPESDPQSCENQRFRWAEANELQQIDWLETDREFVNFLAGSITAG